MGEGLARSLANRFTILLSESRRTGPSAVGEPFDLLAPGDVKVFEGRAVGEEGVAVDVEAEEVRVQGRVVYVIHPPGG